MDSSVQTFKVALISTALWTIISYVLSTKDEKYDIRLFVKESLLFIFPLALTLAVLPELSGGKNWKIFLPVSVGIPVLLIILRCFLIKHLKKYELYQKTPQLVKHFGHIVIRFSASFALLYFFIMVFSFFV